MPTTLDGKTCTVVLFEQPGGDIKSLMTLDGTLEQRGRAMFLKSTDGQAVRIPAHLTAAIEDNTEEHREIMPEIDTDYILRAFYNHRISHKEFDLEAVLEASTGPDPADE